MNDYSPPDAPRRQQSLTTPARLTRTQRGRQQRAKILRHDVPASLVVFLIAIPLSLGIAAASGAPLIAGLVAAVVGGIVAGLFGGSTLQVSGPAAGMTVVVAGLVEQFGWPATAGITMAAGLVQILLGATKVGRYALSLSPAVVHGMLAGIGVTIVVGQLRVLFGGAAHGSALVNLRELPGDLAPPHWGAAVIGLITVGLLLLWPKVPRANVVPAPLVAVVVATAATVLFGLDVARVTLPDDPLTALSLPAMPDGGIAAIALAVLTVALVASVESLLSAVAVDKLHGGKPSDLDRELIGQGAANTVSGALGGLPVTGVIVRSSTNVAAGARTRASTVLHGIWVALFVLLLGGVLELIPMAALAGVLVVVGARLVKLGHLRVIGRHRELAGYGITLLGVVVFGLMEGVALGLAVAVIGALYRLTHTSVKVTDERGSGTGESTTRVTVHGSLVFLGVGRLVRELRRIPRGRRVLLELHVDFMDHAAFEAIDDWRANYERDGGRVDIEEHHDDWYGRARDGEPTRHKTLPSRQRRKTTQAGTFQRETDPEIRAALAELAITGQRPKQLFITCADSRLVPNLITSAGPGDQFCVRNIGNLVPSYQQDGSTADSSVGAAVEFAVDVLQVPTIVVCGHSDCGAMKALVHGTSSPGSRLHSWLRNGMASLERLGRARARTECQLSEVDLLCITNVAQQLDNLRTYPSVSRALAEGRLQLHGLYFDLAQATFYRVNPETVQLEPVRGLEDPDAELRDCL
jgi:carbonic anhydrase